MNILSIEHSLAWSWGIAINALISYSKYDFVRIVRPKNTVAEDLLHGYNAVLVQNVETMGKMDVLDNAIVRMGGMYMDEHSPATRYNDKLSQVAAVIATNPELYEAAKPCNANVHMIPNGVDLDMFRPAKDRPDRKFTIGFAGNIHAWGGDYKGWQYYNGAFISLWSYVKHRECLHAMPPGHRQAQLEHDEMPEGFYHQIDALILPSVNEGCSNVISEALACGVPVLCTEVGYHGKMLTQGENVLFIRRDTQNIVDAIMTLITDPSLHVKLRLAGRDFAERNQDINEIARQYDEVIQGVVNKELCDG